MTALAAALVLGAFVIAYRFYARFLGERIFQDQEDIVTPAHELQDGVDFVPTQRAVLFGHHFTSIAGAAPIIGPCVAAYWGWGPALAWVVLGTIFMGAAHDFGALVASVREKGRSIADITAKTISGRARILFMCFVLVLIWLVLAVFAMAIAGLFVSQPTSVIPINIQIVVALVIGWLVYKRRVKLLWPSLIALAVLYFFVWVGTKAPIDFVAMGVDAHTVTTGWIFFLLIYSAIASLLPVWLLLQPRDYINSHQLFVGLGLLFLGVLIAHPDFDAPVYRTAEAGAPSIFPILFVTIACGAISGFHGLVSSGTTSKQIDRLRDSRLIGYGAMLGEGSLALASTLAAVAGIGLVGACALPGQGVVDDLSWAVYYDSWGHAGGNKAAAFVLGGGAFLEAVGLSSELARTLMAVLVIAFAATSLDTASAPHQASDQSLHRNGHRGGAGHVPRACRDPGSNDRPSQGGRLGALADLWRQQSTAGCSYTDDPRALLLRSKASGMAAGHPDGPRDASGGLGAVHEPPAVPCGGQRAAGRIGSASARAPALDDRRGAHRGSTVETCLNAGHGVSSS
ncbi:MAG: carbon starvation protein A [Deltaproteobacteria bacterium]|nr:carbon starvation protein A [Deltaproteobacteria bacterium]